MRRSPRAVERSDSPPIRSTTPPYVEKAVNPVEANPVEANSVEANSVEAFLKTARIETGAIQRQYDELLARLKEENKDSFSLSLDQKMIRPRDVCIAEYRKLIAQRADETFSVISAFSVSIYSAGRVNSMTSAESDALLEQLKAKQNNADIALREFRNFADLKFEAIVGLIQQNKERQLEALSASETELTKQLNAVDTSAEDRSCLSDALNQCRTDSASIRAELNSLKQSLSASARRHRPLRLSASFDSLASSDSFRDRFFSLPPERDSGETSDLEDAAEAPASDDSENGSFCLSRCNSENTMNYFNTQSESNFPSYL